MCNGTLIWVPNRFRAHALFNALIGWWANLDMSSVDHLFNSKLWIISEIVLLLILPCYSHQTCQQSAVISCNSSKFTKTCVLTRQDLEQDLQWHRQPGACAGATAGSCCHFCFSCLFFGCIHTRSSTIQWWKQAAFCRDCVESEGFSCNLYERTHDIKLFILLCCIGVKLPSLAATVWRGLERQKSRTGIKFCSNEPLELNHSGVSLVANRITPLHLV